VINTAYIIERLQATFRSSACRVGTSLACAAEVERDTGGGCMWLVGTCYNFCWTHKSMRREREGSDPPGGGKWVQSTPAQAAGFKRSLLVG
jgi:hypothetical protein